MITGELKNKIDGLWDIFAAGGLVNPLEVIEQITYLMFIHDLDDSDNMRARESAMLGLPFQSIFFGEVKIGERTIDGSQLKWSVFHDFPADRMYIIMQEWVFPFIKNLHNDKNSAYSKYMDDAIFKLPTPLLLSKVVDSLDEIYKLMNEIQTADVRGDVYEYLLSKIAQSGRNGQFRTPRHIIRMMVEMMDPSSDEIICDPACGTSGFLVAAGEYLKEKRKEEISKLDHEILTLKKQYNSLQNMTPYLNDAFNALNNEELWLLPEPNKLTLASTYHKNIVQPKFSKLRAFIQPLINQVFDIVKELINLKTQLIFLKSENTELKNSIVELSYENRELKRDMNKLKKFFGKDTIENALTFKIVKSKRKEIHK